MTKRSQRHSPPSLASGRASWRRWHICWVLLSNRGLLTSVISFLPSRRLPYWCVSFSCAGGCLQRLFTTSHVSGLNCHAHSISPHALSLGGRGEHGEGLGDTGSPQAGPTSGSWPLLVAPSLCVDSSAPRE